MTGVFTLAGSRTKMKQIKVLLHKVPINISQCMGEEETIIYTADFPKDMSVDVKICGVRFKEGEDNLPWTEAVLFKDGCEISHTDPAEEIEGEWLLYDEADEYVVNMKTNPGRAVIL